MAIADMKYILDDHTSARWSCKAKDSNAQGQSLFAGYHTNSQAFIKNVDGTFTYKGDRGKHTLQISESMNVATSIDGGTAFETVDTGSGRKSVFDIITNVVNTIGNADALSGQGSARAMAALDFKVPRDPQNWSFTLTGSKGAKTINATIFVRLTDFFNNDSLI